jgi:putative transposase
MNEQQRSKPKHPPTIWRIPAELWEKIKDLIPPLPPKKKPGRPRVDDRRVLNGILYVLRTGCQRKQVPREFSSGSTCHKRFSEWVQAGVFAQMWAVLLVEYDALHGIDDEQDLRPRANWEWQSLDSAMGKAPGVPKKGQRSRRSGPTRPTAPGPV